MSLLSAMPRLLLASLLLFAAGIPATPSAHPLFDQFSAGVGDRLTWDNPVGSGDYDNARATSDLLAARGVTAEQARFLGIWMVPGWQPFWFPAAEVQAKVIDRGFVPVFIHWWFGDDTRPSSILAREADYYADLARVGGKYSNEWHLAHFLDPQAVVPGSVMPRYAFLLDRNVRTSDIDRHLVALSRVGVPYDEAMIEALRRRDAARARAPRW